MACLTLQRVQAHREQSCNESLVKPVDMRALLRASEKGEREGDKGEMDVNFEDLAPLQTRSVAAFAYASRKLASAENFSPPILAARQTCWL